MSNRGSHLELQCGAEEQPEDLELAEFRKSLSNNFNVLPLFERAYYEFVHTREYSLKVNAKLAGRWHARVVSGVDRGATAIPNINDYHYHNCRTKFLPSQSLANYPHPRFRLAPGPGVDIYGQRPTPDDMLQKKPTPDQPAASTVKKKTKPKRLRRRSLK